MVSKWSLAFTRKSFGDVSRCLKEISRKTSWRRLIKVRHDFYFRLIEDVFEIKFKAFLRRVCDVFVSARNKNTIIGAQNSRLLLIFKIIITASFILIRKRFF